MFSRFLSLSLEKRQMQLVPKKQRRPQLEQHSFDSAVSRLRQTRRLQKSFEYRLEFRTMTYRSN